MRGPRILSGRSRFQIGGYEPCKACGRQNCVDSDCGSGFVRCFECRKTTEASIINERNEPINHDWYCHPSVRWMVDGARLPIMRWYCSSACAPRDALTLKYCRTRDRMHSADVTDIERDEFERLQDECSKRRISISPLRDLLRARFSSWC